MQTSTVKLFPFFKKLKKTVCALRFHETKLTPQKIFTVNTFALESKKRKSKNDERTFFRDFVDILELAFNP